MTVEPEGAERCRVYSLAGGRCELAAGHEGKHQRHFDTGTLYEWSEVDTRRAIKHYESGRD